VSGYPLAGAIFESELVLAPDVASQAIQVLQLDDTLLPYFWSRFTISPKPFSFA